MDSLPRFPAALLALLAPLAGACGGADPPAAEPAPPAAAGRSASGSVGPAASADEPARDVSPLVGDPGPLPDAPAEGLAHWRGTFEEEAAARGLSYRNRSGRPGNPTILEANGSGLAVLDLGGDGDLDLAFGQGVESLDALIEGPGADVELFRNDGTAHFERAQGPGLSGWWTGLAAGDVDGDGRTDLVVGGYGGLELLLQDASGDLQRREDAGIAPPPDGLLVPGAEREPGSFPDWTTGLALFDADLDGRLDLYAGRYLDLDPLDPPLGSLGEGALEFPCWWKGHEVYCGPRGLPAQPDVFFLGRDGARFDDATDSSLPPSEPGFTLAVAAFDADGDGDADLYVANDSVPNRLFVNDGHGRFADYAPQSGVAVDPDGEAQAGMGIAFGDVDRNGVLDLAVTNFSEEPTELYFGAPVGFRAQTHRLGLGRASRRLLSWGVHLVDFDGDGWLDLFTANGHVYPQADEPYTGTSYAQRDTIWTLRPDRPVREVAVGGERSLLALETVSRGSAVADLDRDGTPDLVLTTLDGPALLGINRTRPETGEGHRLSLRCLGPVEPVPGPQGRRTPRDGTGTRVVVVPEPPEGEPPHGLLGEARTAGSYQSSSTPWLHFGLGGSARYRSIEIRWPSGRVDRLPGGAADRALVVREGEGVIAEESRP